MGKKLGMIVSICMILVGCSGNATSTPLDSTLNVVNPTPVIDESRGGVTFKVIHTDTGRPVVGEMAFYLAELLPVNSSSEMYVPAVDITIAPAALSDENGVVMVTASPGRYAVIMYIPLGMILLTDTKINQDFIVTIEANKIIELGDVYTVFPEEFIQ